MSLTSSVFALAGDRAKPPSPEGEGFSAVLLPRTRERSVIPPVFLFPSKPFHWVLTGDKRGAVRNCLYGYRISVSNRGEDRNVFLLPLFVSVFSYFARLFPVPEPRYGQKKRTRPVSPDAFSVRAMFPIGIRIGFFPPGLQLSCGVSAGSDSAADSSAVSAAGSAAFSGSASSSFSSAPSSVMR